MTARIGLLGDRDPDSCLDLGSEFVATHFATLDDALATDPPIVGLIIAVPQHGHVHAEIRRIRATTAGIRLPILLLVDSVDQYVESIDTQGTTHHDSALIDFCGIDAGCKEITVRLVWLIEAASAVDSRISTNGSDRLVALYERLMNSLSDMIAVVDQEGHHLLFNRAGRDLCEIPDSVPTGTIDARDLTPDDTLETLSETVFPAMRRDGSWAGRSELLSTTGERIPVWQQWFTITDPDGNQVLTGTHARDLRESDRLLYSLAETNAALVRNTQRFDAIMQTTPDLVGFADADGTLFNLNPAGRELLGLAPDDDLNGMRLLDLHPEDLEQFGRTVALPHAMRHGSWSGETSIVRTDGSTVPVWQVLMVIHEEGEDAPILVTFVRDLRDLRSLQTQVEHAQEARARAEAAELAKSRFLANMSHEIRTPLNAVLGYSQLLEMDDLSADQTESVRAIRRAGSHLLALINDVLDLSRIEAGASNLNPQPTDLHLLLAEVETMFARECAEHGLRWRMTIEVPAPDWVMVDRQRLTQVVANLLDNAIKFTEEGEISLVVRRRIDGETVFEIADTGRGMTVSELTNVFAPFTQGTSGSLYGGTGLGLSITRNLVDMMRGNIRMSLRPQGGVKAVVSVPLLSTERIVDEESASDSPAVPSFNDLTAVVVDDIEDNRKVLANLLGRHGVGVREASNGLELLEMLEEFEPDIVFLDIRMPEMDGHAALAEAKRRWPDRSTLYVAVTATGIATTRATYLRYGFHDLIKKPFHFNEIAIFLAGIRRHAEPTKPADSLAGISAADRGTATMPTKPAPNVEIGAAAVPGRAGGGSGGLTSSADGAVSGSSQAAAPAAAVARARCHIPEPFRQQMVDAAELGRVIQLRRVLAELSEALSNPVGPTTKGLGSAEIEEIQAEIAYVKSLADSYDLERTVTYLTN